MNEMDIVRARRFATEAHLGQYRKFTGEPYIMHPIRVAEMVAGVTDSKYAIIAALLHDVVEDSDFTTIDIINRFGITVSQMVSDLTDPPKGPTRTMPNRSTRKNEIRRKLASCCELVQTIKMADIIDNINDLDMFDASFKEVYTAEQSALVLTLDKANPSLREIAANRLNIELSL